MRSLSSTILTRTKKLMTSDLRLITDKPLDTMGNIADGGRSVTERFIMEADDIGNAMSNGEWMIVDKIGPDSNYSFRYNIKSRQALEI